MSKPESFVRATPEELWRWVASRASEPWTVSLAALRDAVVAEKDAEFAMKRDPLLWTEVVAAWEALGVHTVTPRAVDSLAKRIGEVQARAERAEAEVARLTQSARDAESASHAYRRSSEEWQRRFNAAKSALADAQRAGAWEALTKLSYKYEVEWGSPHTGSEVAKFRDTHYAPPAPEPPSVRLGNGWVVRYDPNTMAAKWQADGKIDGHTGTRFEYELYDLLHAMRYTPTPTEYAALVALAEAPDAE